MTLNNQELIASYSVLRDQLEAQAERGLGIAEEIGKWLKDGQAWMEAGENLRLATVALNDKITSSQRDIYNLLREHVAPDDAPDFERL
jgi:hypothetical protein